MRRKVRKSNKIPDLDKSTYKNDDLQKKLIDVDILYSITAHENPKFISRLIENINTYNKKYNIFIVINGSTSVNKNNVNCDFDNYIFNHKFRRRRKYTYDILGAHVDNYILANENNIKFKHMMLLASNCLFVKQLDLKKVNYLPKEEEDKGRFIPFYRDTEIKCPQLVDIYKELGVPESGNNKSIFSHIHRHHEGTLYTKQEADKIFQFIIDKIHFKINYNNYVAEEELLSYLEYVFFDKILRPRIAVITNYEMEFYDNSDAIKEKMSKEEYILYRDTKKMPREKYSNYRDYITNKYKICMKKEHKYIIKDVNRDPNDLIFEIV